MSDEFNTAEKVKLKYKEHFQDNEPFQLTIVDLNYKTHTHDEYGTSYEFMIRHEEASVWYASKTVVELIQAAKITPDTECVWEFCNVKFDDKYTKFWKLNGKTKRQWLENEQEQSNIDRMSKQIAEDKSQNAYKPVQEKPASPRHENRHENLFEVADRVAKLEKEIEALKSKLNPNEVPF